MGVKPGAVARRDAILRRCATGARVAEVGVFRGTLSAQLLAVGRLGHLLMIDNWAPASKQPAAYVATGDYNACLEAAEVAQYRREALKVQRRHRDTATIMEATSVAAASAIGAGSLDLVFLDADHSYAAVVADIAAWLPKVKPGGWIGGHDYRNPEPGFDFTGVDRAVDEWAAISGAEIETDENFTWFARVQ